MLDDLYDVIIEKDIITALDELEFYYDGVGGQKSQNWIFNKESVLVDSFSGKKIDLHKFFHM